MPDIEKEDALDASLAPQTSITTPLINEGNDLVKQIIEEKDPSKLNDLTQLFNMNKAKKQIARQNKLSNLLEVIDDEIVMRVSSYPDTLDNDQILRYMESTQKAIAGVEQSINQVPTIQINSQTNEIHVNNSGLDRDSRAKVLSAVQSILASVQKEVVDVEVEKND